MRKFLIDTHILLWWMEKSPKLKDHHYRIIENPGHLIAVSICSIFEIYIKISIGRLELGAEIQPILVENDFKVVPIAFHHLETYKSLPLHHRDPFDRMILAQGKTENYTIISDDHVFSKYDVQLI